MRHRPRADRGIRAHPIPDSDRPAIVDGPGSEGTGKEDE